MYKKTLLDNGIYKIETLALDYMNDLICFYQEKNGVITDDGYLFNELSNKPRIMSEDLNCESKMKKQCYKIAQLLHLQKA